MVEIKLPEILRTLIDQQGYRRNRGPILDAAHVSGGALSQYLSGNNNPSLPVLIELADFFKVSLDYLVLGREHRSGEALDYGPLARYVDLSLARVQDHTTRHSALVSRIARTLAGQIDAVAKSAAGSSGAPVSGVVYDNETLALESFSTETRLISMNLTYDILVDPLSGDEAEGRFLTAVAENLEQGRSYKFILPKELNDDWGEIVRRYRSLLLQHMSTDSALGNCHFRVSDLPIFTGMGLYKLDTDAMASSDPLLLGQVNDFIGEDGWMGYAIPPSDQLLADSLFDELHLSNALSGFDVLWRRAKSV